MVPTRTGKLGKAGEHFKSRNFTKTGSVKDRVATAQGKQGIWLLTGNLVNLFFYTGKMVPTQGKF